MACGAVFVLILSLALSISSLTALAPARLPCPQSLEDWKPRDRAFIECLNKEGSTWTAKFNKAFENFTTLEEFRKIMGGLEEKNDTDTPERPKRQAGQMPASFDARRAWPGCPTIRQIRNQRNCGSCWAVAVAAAASDRTCICLNGARKPELSSEDVLWCSSGSFGCNGGYHRRAWQFWVTTGIVTGGEFGTNQGCKPYAMTPPCKFECSPGYLKTYWADKDKEGVAWYRLPTVQAIQRDIMLRGSVTAFYRVYTDFYHLGSGVYRRRGGSYVGNHIVRIIGWGTERGVPYWLCANQWGTNWGDNGLFKFLRGSNHLDIERWVWAARCKNKVKLEKCNGVWYNPKIQGCCCGVRVYYLHWEHCCPYGNVLRNFLVCPYCSGRAYNPLLQGCCRGRIYNRFTRKCCRDGRIIWISYPCIWPRCNGRPYNPYVGLRCCAGKKIYSIYTQKCCPGGWVVVKEKKCPLCRGRPYNPDIHACCRGRTIYIKSTHKCCPNGRVELRNLPCVWPRCNGRPYNPLMGLRCCFGRTIYSIFTQKCCPGGWVVVNGKNCPLCLGRPYNPDTHACCRGRTIYNKSLFKCCPDGRVILRFLPCIWPRCRGRPYNPLLGQRCCGGKRIYNILTQKCCPYGWVVPKRLKCPLCRLRPYNPETHQCCYGLWLWPRNLRCPYFCKSLRYNPRTHGCCGGRIYRKFTHFCCGDRIYRKHIFRCCRSGRIVVGRICLFTIKRG